MKRALVLAVATIMALAITLPTFGFFSFGYMHIIPENEGKMFAEFTFTPGVGSFDFDLYLVDVWGVQSDSSTMRLGVGVSYDMDTPLVDLTAGGYLESTALGAWPEVGTEKAGIYLDSVFHILPYPCNELDPCGGIGLDFIANFDLSISASTGQWDLGGEVGFEVEL